MSLVGAHVHHPETGRSVVLLCMVLLVVFLWGNLDKIQYATLVDNMIVNGKKRLVLDIKDSEGEKISNFQLATSDLFDRTGERSVHFYYFDTEAFERISSRLKEKESIRFYLNEDRIDNVDVIRLHEHVISLVLPEDRLYLVAPPHLELAMRALRFERKQRRDIFSCKGKNEFCSSVKLVGYGGVTDIIERTLAEDNNIPEAKPLPRGRWVTDKLGLSLHSDTARTVKIHFDMRTPMIEQRVHITRPHEATLRILKEGSLDGLGIPGISMGDYVFEVILPLKPGSTPVLLQFDIVTERAVDIPLEMSGILTNVSVAPADDI
ncbi:MAG: hypothetical protein D6698_15120 [Gammaproteobacteria bacterium]|nr:MAG: hypothetical protein D6698_15120 [Gammaproteobacteria bacterium]